MTRKLLLLTCLLPAVGTSARGAAPDDKPGYKSDVAPFLAKHCTGCHGGAKPKGGVVLDPSRDEAAAVKDRALWEKVADNLRAGNMPPPRKPRPSEAELDRVNRWLDSAVFGVDCGGPRDPGRVTIRRLNRAEYNNTIRDLFGISLRPADDFPSDDVGYGFDNVGDVLSMPPLLMEKYLAAAEKVVDAAWKDDAARKQILRPAGEEKDKAKFARRVLRPFADRAWRRPATDDELRRLTRFVEIAERNGDSPDAGIRLGLQTVLVSPNFLFRVELDPPPKKDGAKPHRVSDWELASRLSYFLWSSMPDDQLFRLAREGQLHEPEVLQSEVRRMVRDEKARSLVENFASQWLQLRNLKGFSPDPVRFPEFDEPLRAAMQRETELFFENVVREDRSALELLDADYTFVNERLAKHYGIPGVKGEEFQKISVAGTPRGGLVTQASVLTVTSNPTRTSPVKRGKWILENLLASPIPPPPPGVEELKDDKPGAELPGTLRQRMEQHRANPNCAVCHQRMDPLGFGLENFNAVGGWRTRDGKEPVDASGLLPDGRSFNGPAELKAVLLARKDQFARCLSEKMLAYALGRETERTDRCTVDAIARDLAAADYRFSALVRAVVRSEPFLMRRAQGGAKK